LWRIDMKKLMQYIGIDRYFLLPMFGLCYLLTIQARLNDEALTWMLLTPDAPIAMLIGSLLIFIIVRTTINILSSNRFSLLATKQTKSDQYSRYAFAMFFLVSLIIYILVTNAFSFLIALIFNNIERNFNFDTLLLVNVERIVEYILFAGLYLAYIYAKDVSAYKMQISQYNHTLSQSKIKQLKSQLNPHFLFNSLNTLDELIYDSQDRASAFLNDFAELYRYSMITSDKKLVTVEQELEFVSRFFKLIEIKYPQCYTLSINPKNTTPVGFIPPFCLQLLVENAIEHNMGSPTNPVHITIEMAENIQVSNNKVTQKNKRNSSGRALENLNQQYKLLEAVPITIEEDATQFSVSLPIIESEQHD
jgi:sensor histidine kinase YesM